MESRNTRLLRPERSACSLPVYVAVAVLGMIGATAMVAAGSNLGGGIAARSRAAPASERVAKLQLMAMGHRISGSTKCNQQQRQQEQQRNLRVHSSAVVEVSPHAAKTKIRSFGER